MEKYMNKLDIFSYHKSKNVCGFYIYNCPYTQWSIHIFVISNNCFYSVSVQFSKYFHILFPCCQKHDIQVFIEIYLLLQKTTRFKILGLCFEGFVSDDQSERNYLIGLIFEYFRKKFTQNFLIQTGIKSNHFVL